jgi:sortase A
MSAVAGDSESVRRGPDARDVIRGIGEVLITLGVIVFLFIAYELWFTGLYTARAQSNLKNQLSVLWAQPTEGAASQNPASGQPSSAASAGGSGAPSSAASAQSSAPSAAASPSAPTVASVPIPGKAVGLIRIPRLGLGYAYAIIEGVSTDDLKKGPGHYPGTALPGQVGNFVLSGHRTTYLAPFSGLGELVVGDAIVIETRDTWYTYKVSDIKTVLPTEVDVVLPVPGHPGRKATQATITLTTCTPKYSASHRLVVEGVLASATPKSAGLPPALEGS